MRMEENRRVMIDVMYMVMKRKKRDFRSVSVVVYICVLYFGREGGARCFSNYGIWNLKVIRRQMVIRC